MKALGKSDMDSQSLACNGRMRMERRGRGRLFLSSAAQRYITVSHGSSGIGDGLGVARLEPSFKDLPQKAYLLE